MVKPTQDDQVVLIGAASLAPRDQMVNLESIAAVTAVSPAHVSVFGHQRSFQRRWCGPPPPSVVHQAAIRRPGDYLCLRVAQDRFEGLATGADTRIQDDSRLPVCWGGIGGIHDHRDLSRGRIVGDQRLHELLRVPSHVPPGCRRVGRATCRRPPTAPCRPANRHGRQGRPTASTTTRRGSAEVRGTGHRRCSARSRRKPGHASPLPAARRPHLPTPPSQHPLRSGKPLQPGRRWLVLLPKLHEDRDGPEAGAWCEPSTSPCPVPRPVDRPPTPPTTDSRQPTQSGVCPTPRESTSDEPAAGQSCARPRRTAAPMCPSKHSPTPCSQRTTQLGQKRSMNSQNRRNSMDFSHHGWVWPTARDGAGRRSLTRPIDDGHVDFFERDAVERGRPCLQQEDIEESPKRVVGDRDDPPGGNRPPQSEL